MAMSPAQRERHRKATRSARRGFVYFFQLGRGPIKIGWATDVARRFRDVVSYFGPPVRYLGALPGTRATELALQRRFRTARVRRGQHPRVVGREFFRPVPALLRRIASLRPVSARALVEGQFRNA